MYARDTCFKTAMLPVTDCIQMQFGIKNWLIKLSPLSTHFKAKVQKFLFHTMFLF